MKLDKFAYAIEKIGLAIDKSPIPIYQCVYLRSTGHALLMVGRGSTSTIARYETHDEALNLDIAVPFDLISRILGAMPDGELEIWQKGNVLHLRCQESDAKIVGMMDDRGLMGLSIPENGWIEFVGSESATTITSALSRVRYAADKEKFGRGALSGVSLRLDCGRLEATAFDGVQFASSVSDAPGNEVYCPEFNITLAGDAVSPVMKIGQEMGYCRVHVSNSRLTMQSFDPGEMIEWWLVEGALLDGKHPGRAPISTVLAARHDEAVLSKTDLLMALGMIVAMRATRAILHLSPGGVVLSSPEAESGSTSQLIDTERLPAHEDIIALDPKYLQEALLGVSGKWVTVSTSRIRSGGKAEVTGPVHIRGHDYDGFDALVMIKTVSGPVLAEKALA